MRSSISQLSLHKLEVFCTVAELGSVSHAAERLGIAQPVVSAHLKALSEKVGTQLTRRNGRSIALTEDGQRVLKWAREVTFRTLEIERELIESRSGLRGKAVIGASLSIGSYVLPSVVAEFQLKHPNADIAVLTGTPAFVMDAVQDGRCDFAFLILDPKRDLSGFEADALRAERLLLLKDPRTPLPSSVTAEMLCGLPFVTAQTGTPRRELEEIALRKYGLSRNHVTIEFGTAEAMKQGVRSGMGVAFLFENAVIDELRYGVLEVVETPGLDFQIPSYLLRRKRKQLNRYQTQLMHELTRALQETKAVPAT
ncbi:HTH-type transcriptional activator CmpR (plasmid) [Antarctobacter heliothermus]|uniref:HTH-type transcriptional activator CmpR n=1 Tax=Antarctobacter heliothermus TaxID=74033 RepID=A0A222ECK1_9RHOB|nr:LysR family transcriptional regulator [Antarctobacter heliothermus]ASP23681.1 HTH-type transcriptional activator CmpR [Antarctobacter heliothermus]